MKNNIVEAQIANLEDYSHSANSIFHFMKEEKYLLEALDNRRLVPRYCNEDVKYLQIWHNGKNAAFNNILIPLKCFCDIKLHNINNKVSYNDIQRANSNQEIQRSHIQLYGTYALGFSKVWAETKGIQPVMYVNKNSPFATQLIETITKMLESEAEDNNNYFENLVAYQLSFIKPLRGYMSRPNEVLNKNFHDEHEWRYVPSFENIPSDYMAIIMEQSCIEDKSIVNAYNDMLQKNDTTHLKFDYDDIKYIIVPNEEERDKIIMHIYEAIGCAIEAYRLISKLVILTDILKDW